MGLTINEGKSDAMASVTVDRRLWLAADRETLVEDGDPRATFLWAACEGREVQADEAERVGYAPARSVPEAPDVDSSADYSPSDPEPDEVEPEPEPEPLPDGHVACDVDGCDYTGTERGLKVHARSHDSEDD